MRVLVIGGTRFLGRQIVTVLLARGHDVTLFNRGISGSDLFPGVERVIGDRKNALGASGSLSDLGDRHFDAVIDPSAYVPRDVERAVEALRERTKRYCFISSVSVYPDDNERFDEGSPLAAMPEGASRDEMVPETYGALKVLCEAAARAGFGEERTHVVRPGLIVGPYDPTDRFTYWLVRVARGGDVLVPGKPSDPVQFIDVRDLANFVVRSLELGRSGVDNATSPIGRFTLAEVLSSALDLSKSDATFTWVSPEFLERHEIEMWSDLPVWAPKFRALCEADTSRAIAAGLPTRELDDTVAATLAWHATRGDVTLSAGLTPEREQVALLAWHRERSNFL